MSYLTARRASNRHTAYASARIADPLLGRRHAAGGRIAHSIGLLLAIVAIVAIGVIIGHPSEKSGNQPNFAGAEQQQKRLAVFLDGTWNSVNSNTNVWRMRALCASKSKDGKPQLVYYEVGVNGFLGGVFGQGLDENIRLAYEWLIEKLQRWR